MTIAEVLHLHRMVIEQAGGAMGLHDLAALESAVGQPQATFGGEQLYPDVPEMAAALAFFLVCNHPFIDGNKRVGHAAMEVAIALNGYTFLASVDEQESTFLSLAGGELSRESFAEWVRAHTTRAGSA